MPGTREGRFDVNSKASRMMNSKMKCKKSLVCGLSMNVFVKSWRV